jgi:hypothetical protein
LGFQQD